MVVVFVGGVVVGGHAEATGLTQLRDPLRGLLLGDSGESLPSQVLDVLRDDYYKPIDEQKLESLSVDRMIEALNDPYTDYLSADELDRARASSYDGTYSGVGLGWRPREAPSSFGASRPTAPRTRPASGRRPAGVDRREAHDRRRPARGREPGPGRGGHSGAPGRGHRRRAGAAAHAHAPRAHRAARALRASRPSAAGRWATCACHGSSRGSASALGEAVKRLRAKGAQALVLDLRQDPGGL